MIKEPFRSIGKLYNWIDDQDNWVSALSHAAIVAVGMTIGLALEFASYTVEPSDPIPFITFFAGAGIGAYTLREIDDARKAIGRGDEGERLGQGFEDWIAPVVTCVALGVFYASLF